MTWLLYAVGATLMIAAAPVLAKAGAKKSDSALSASLSALAVLIMTFVITPGSLNSFSLNGMGTKGIICLILSGVALGLCTYFFFSAIGNGDLISVAPVIKCNIVITLVAEILIWHKAFNNMMIAKAIIIVIGTVVMVVGGKNYKWLIHALLSAICISASKLVLIYGFGSGASNMINTLKIIIAVILLIGIAIGTGGIKKLKSITFFDGVLLILAGLAIGFFKIVYSKAAFMAGAAMAETFYRFELFAIVLLAGVILKEKLSARAVLGSLIIIAALFL